MCELYAMDQQRCMDDDDVVMTKFDIRKFSRIISLESSSLI